MVQPKYDIIVILATLTMAYTEGEKIMTRINIRQQKDLY